MADKAEEYAYSVYPEDQKGFIYDIARNNIIRGYEQAEKDLCQDAYVYKRGVKYGYERGYNQAKKDLALTWKDVEKVCLIAREVHQFRGFWSESVYQEVLKRFLERKNV